MQTEQEASVEMRLVAHAFFLMLTILFLAAVTWIKPIPQAFGGWWAIVLVTLGVIGLAKGFVDDVRLSRRRAILHSQCDYSWFLLDEVFGRHSTEVRRIAQRNLLAIADELTGATAFLVLLYRLLALPFSHLVVGFCVILLFVGWWVLEDYLSRGPLEAVKHGADCTCYSCQSQADIRPDDMSP